MSRCRVVIASYLEPELVERIAASEPRADIAYEPRLLPAPRFPSDHSGAPPELSAGELARWRKLTAEAEVLFDFDWHEPETLPERCPRLRWIQATSAGIGGVMTRTGLDRSAIEVTTAAGIHAVPLAEFALLGALHFIKGMPQLTRWKAARRWEWSTTQRLAGRRVLVVGVGAIGREVARTFAALGAEVTGLSRRTPAQLPPGVSRTIARAELTGELARTDVVVIACPLTEHTRGLLGAAELAALPGHAIVVNVGRGPVIDEPALVAALAEGRLAGACLDVFAEEPLPAESPLWGMENVIVSPHSASTLADENAALVELFLDNLARYLDGRPRRNVYDAAAGY
jgi:phosphoglycerate dehydrogenase-like enzyme